MIALRPLRYRSAETEARRFVALAADVREWLTLDEWVWRLDEARFWSQEMGDRPGEAQKRRLVRKLLSFHEEGQLWPTFCCLHVWTEGDREPVWRPEATFDVAEYRYVVQHFARLGGVFSKKARQYAARCWARFRVRVRVQCEVQG